MTTKSSRQSRSPAPLISGAAEPACHPDASSPNGAGESGAAVAQSSSREETADYIAEMSSELGRIARASGLDLVAYLLEMSAYEASKHRTRPEPVSP